jgi:hypothetical protein
VAIKNTPECHPLAGFPGYFFACRQPQMENTDGKRFKLNVFFGFTP